MAMAVLGILLTSPIWLAAALTIRARSTGPIMYRSERVGRYGKRFQLYKFRTMVMSEAEQLRVTASNDARVTAPGRVLRRWKVDELPQLLNVIKGEMSVFGPRPEDPRYVKLYDAEQRRLLDVRPGLISPAVVAYRHEERLLGRVADPEEEYVSNILPHKLEMDLRYLAQRSAWTDAALLFRAIRAVFRTVPD